MKKFLLLGAAAVAALGASAQTQYVFMTPTDWDGSADQPAGTVLCETEFAKFTNMFDEPMKNFNPSRNPYNYVSVGGGDLIEITNGVSGNNNPKGQGMNALPTSGMVYQLTTTKPGYYTFLTKMNSNKNYWLLKGSSFSSYRLGDCNLSKAEGVIDYTLPYDEWMDLDLNAADVDVYFTLNDDNQPTGPKVPWQVVNPDGEDMGEGSGFVTVCSFASEDFPEVFTFFAQGSKAACNGFIYTPCEDPTYEDAPEVVFGGIEKVADDGTVTPAPTPIVFPGKIYNDESGIENIAADAAAADAPMYNVLGQRVNESYKGLVIKNGKKFINK